MYCLHNYRPDFKLKLINEKLFNSKNKVKLLKKLNS